MFLLILDKNPYKAAELVPDRLKFKQLLELCQLICSAEISNVYKKIYQGKELQEWIKNNRMWTFRFLNGLWFWHLEHIKAKPQTSLDIYKIRNDLLDSFDNKKRLKCPKTIIFRYVKEYKSIYPSNSELPIDIGIGQYKRYLIWKEERRGNKKCMNSTKI